MRHARLVHKGEVVREASKETRAEAVHAVGVGATAEHDGAIIETYEDCGWQKVMTLDVDGPRPAMRVYLSGPMRGYPQFNYPAFAKATEALRAAGYEVVSPHEFIPAGQVPSRDDLRRAFAAYCEFICTKADLVVVLPGWERSPGATTEVGLARNCGLLVLRMEDPDPLVAYLDDQIVEALCEPEGTPAPPWSEFAARIAEDIERGGRAKTKRRFSLNPKKAGTDA